MNYAGLKQAIQDWLNAPELEESIPTFIEFAEANFNRNLRTHDMIGRSYATVTSDYFTVPTDWLETIGIICTSTRNWPLDYVEYDQFNKLKGSNLTGNPRYFTMVDGKFMIYPAATVNAPINLEISYFKKISSLSDIVTTNWLLTKSPDLYLFGALVEADPYLQKDGRVMLWAGKLEKAMEGMRIEGERSKRRTGGLNANRRSFG